MDWELYADGPACKSYRAQKGGYMMEVYHNLYSDSFGFSVTVNGWYTGNLGTYPRAYSWETAKWQAEHEVDLRSA